MFLFSVRLSGECRDLSEVSNYQCVPETMKLVHSLYRLKAIYTTCGTIEMKQFKEWYLLLSLLACVQLTGLM